MVNKTIAQIDGLIRLVEPSGIETISSPFAMPCENQATEDDSSTTGKNDHINGPSTPQSTQPNSVVGENVVPKVLKFLVFLCPLKK